MLTGSVPTLRIVQHEGLKLQAGAPRFGRTDRREPRRANSAMDLATGVGLLGGVGVVFTLILIEGGDFATYFDRHALLVMLGGSVIATLIRFPFSALAHGVPLGLRYAFTVRAVKPRDLIDEIARIADVVRQSGPKALENVEIANPFLARGARSIADGHDRDAIRSAMERDRDTFLMHLDEGSKIYRAFGHCAPVWGMIGTVLGMMAIFANLSDPSKLGSAMATALLATLYGTLIANLIILPIADKLRIKLREEEISRSLIIDGILLIHDQTSAALVRETLADYLPYNHRPGMETAPA
jgi:chemotaxis protein MotA